MKKGSTMTANTGKAKGKARRSPKQFEPYVATAGRRGIDDAVIIDPSKVVTAPWVRMKCQYGCAGYGMRALLPPAFADAGADQGDPRFLLVRDAPAPPLVEKLHHGG